MSSSEQRLCLPDGKDARWAADEYVRWLPRALLGLIRAEVDPDRSFRFYLRGLGPPLLVLAHAPEKSDAGRQLFLVTRGLLVDSASQGRFEFRVDGGTLVTTVHDYAPTLPPWLYVLTQARVHEWVMMAFARHLSSV